MSIRTEFEKIMLQVPNIATASLHLGFFLTAMLVSLFPKSTPIYKTLRDLGHQYTLDSEERKKIQRERITTLVKLDKQNAEEDKLLAQTIAPIQIEEKDHLSKKILIEADKAYKERLIQAKEDGKKYLLSKQESQEISGIRDDTKFRAEELETEFRTGLFTRFQAHLEKMTNLNHELRSAADSLNEVTLGNKSITEDSTQSITELNGSMELLIEANLNLQKAIHNYDIVISKGDANSAQENAITQALMTSIKAEKKIETMLDTDRIIHNSELKQAFMADVGQKNEQINKLLYKCSNQTLTNLSDLIQKEITEIQAKSDIYTKPSDIDACKKNLNMLIAKLEQIDHIRLDKDGPHAKIKANP